MKKLYSKKLTAVSIEVGFDVSPTKGGNVHPHVWWGNKIAQV